MNVRKFYCRYDEQLPLGEGVQIFLEIQYEDRETFDSEMKRFSLLSDNCDEYFKDSGFSAYATHLGVDFSSEYALLDKENQVIYYIYLQNLPKEEIEFEDKFLPDGYIEFGKLEQVNN